MKAGEDNPQAREEEDKLYLLQYISVGISGMWIGIPWENHLFQMRATIGPDLVDTDAN